MPGRDLLEQRGAPRHQYGSRAFGREHLGNAAADAVARTGHDRDLALQRSGHHPWGGAGCWARSSVPISTAAPTSSDFKICLRMHYLPIFLMRTIVPLVLGMQAQTYQRESWPIWAP